MRTFGIGLAAVLALTVSAPAQAQIATADVTGGTVSGETAGGISMFKGIPFAAAPVGDLRWKAPEPVVPWQGVRKATAFGAACMQGFNMLRQQGSEAAMSEDCLFLDVWTPAKSADEKRPVIVWIHGGGYTMGATSVGLYDGKHFAESGVVFVSLAYRLGSLGFLATPELSAESGKGSGNFGLLDMVQGLEWVQQNIAKFGGDPSRVTIMGHSAGASAVSVLTASELTKGMIDGVIAESGGNFAPVQTGAGSGMGMSTLASAEQRGKDWLASLGANTLAEARAVPAAKLNDAQAGPGTPGWRPVLDNYVLKGDQVRLWQQGRFNDIPLLLGTTSNEFRSMPGRAPSGDFADNVRRTYGSTADSLLKAYPHGSETEVAQSNRSLTNEAGLESNAFAWASSQAGHAKSPTYYYWFNNSESGSSHGSEVGLVFGNEDNRPGREPWSEHNRALSNQLHSYWVNFATTGNPNGAGLPNWPQFDPAKPSVLGVGLETRVIDVPDRSRMEILAQYFDSQRKE